VKPRSARVRAFAKINLGLRVLHKRADGYHEIRTILQTISLADRLSIEYEKGTGSEIDLDCDPPIEDNLVLKAVHKVMDAGDIRGHVRIRINKQVPMGAGLGGGSSDAAAVLLALPALAGARLPFSILQALAPELGSDVPFFLMGGTALALGRGEELYPLPSVRERFVVLAVPPVHCATPAAYQALGRAPAGALTFAQSLQENSRFQNLARALGMPEGGEDWKAHCLNDFETVVFDRHPELRTIAESLRRLGAKPALLCGSGSALFGIFNTSSQLETAMRRMAKERKGTAEARLMAVEFISRRRYQAAYWRALGPNLDGKVWPPRSRFGP
jgi:4-diphosphocytidyl-2-C-methyl-D-erythritol kinase